jgi:phage terminase large subunit
MRSTRKNWVGEPLLPPWAAEFLPSRPETRYKIAYGGRGSAKSWTFARMAVIRASVRPVRILCARELQNSIQDSVHQLISDQIVEMGLTGKFDVKENAIRSSIGAEFLFKGLRGMRNNAQALKSLEGVDICWIEEGQTVSHSSLETLTPTIRKPNSEIWITFNPDQPTDPVMRMAKNPPPGSIVRKVNWDANPWFGKTSLPREREWMQSADPDAYAHVWLGEFRTHTDAQVLKGKYRIESFYPDDGWDGPYFGADWGFSVDPTALVKLWIHGQRLYVEHEAWGVGVEIDHLANLFDTVPGSRSHLIRADSARPETISYMQRQGFNIVGAEKGKGSVEDGVAHLRGYESIVIHPRCIHAAEEARLWSYKTDRLSGDILPVLADGFEHCWDAVRYGLEPIIRQSGFGLIGFMAGEAAKAKV